MTTLNELALSIQKLELQKAEIDAQLKGLQETLRAGVHEQFAQAFIAADKMSGDITLVLEGVKLKGKIPKKVVWDNRKLQALAASLPWDQAQKIFDIKFSVPEKNYSALSIAGSDLVAKLDDARTVEIGDFKVEVMGDGNA